MSTPHEALQHIAAVVAGVCYPARIPLRYVMRLSRVIHKLRKHTQPYQGQMPARVSTPEGLVSEIHALVELRDACNQDPELARMYLLTSDCLRDIEGCLKEMYHEDD